MGSSSQIEWTDASWNIVVGCDLVSPGCTNCYAMRDAARRLDGNPKTPHYRDTTKTVNGKPVWTGVIGKAPEKKWLEPLKRRKPTVYFVNSMGDLFHEHVPDEWIDQAFAIMALCPQHVFQILTKRPERMRAYMNDAATRDRIEAAAFDVLDYHYGRDRAEEWAREPGEWPLPNVWLGVSAEDQRRLEERVPSLLDTLAAVRFVSCEPLLGPLDFDCVPYPKRIRRCVDDVSEGIDALRHESVRLDWVIAGGESGPDARPMHPVWARSLRNQCVAARVPFFFKQWGEWAPTDRWRVHQGAPAACAIDAAGDAVPYDVNPDEVGGQRFSLVGKRAAGRMLDGRTHDDMPAGVRLEKAA